MLANSNRDEILNVLGHEFGHYSKEDNKTGNQSIANYSGNKLEDRTKDMVAKEATEDTLAEIRNNKNVITGEEGRQLADSIPMDRREYYKAVVFLINGEKFMIGAESGVGFIYNKEPITGEEEFGYVVKLQGNLGMDFNLENIKNGKSPFGFDWGIEGYEKPGKPIKDLEGKITKFEFSLGAFGIGIGAEIDASQELSVNGMRAETGFKFMFKGGYIWVFKDENLNENTKELIRTITASPEKTADTVEGVRMLKDVIKKYEKYKGRKK